MNLLSMIPKPGDFSPEESKQKFAELEEILGGYFDIIAATHQVQRSDLALHILLHLDKKGTQHLRYFVLHKNGYYWVNGKDGGEKLPLKTSFGKIIGNPIVALLDNQIDNMAIKILNDFAKRNDLDPVKICIHISAKDLSKYVLYEGIEYMKIDVINAINEFQPIQNGQEGTTKSLPEPGQNGQEVEGEKGQETSPFLEGRSPALADKTVRKPPFLQGGSPDLSGQGDVKKAGEAPAPRQTAWSGQTDTKRQGDVKKLGEHLPM